MPEPYATRIAFEKAALIQKQNVGKIILAADTVVSVGRRILPQANEEQEAIDCLKLLSGRRHRVTTAIAAFDEAGKTYQKQVQTVVKFKRMTDAEIAEYIECGEWQGKAGGYAIQGFAGSFVQFLSGSYSNVVGLPLYETRNLMHSLGII